MPRPEDIAARKRREAEERRIRATFKAWKKRARYSGDWGPGDVGWRSRYYILLARKWRRPISEIKRIVRGE